MVRDMHIEGESQADYYLEVYDVAAQNHGVTGHDNDEVSRTEQHHSTFGYANNDMNSDVSDIIGAGSTVSSSSSDSSCIEWFKTVSSSSIWESSPPSDDENYDDELFGPDPGMQVIPVDYSEDRENQRRWAAGHTKPVDPWAFSECNKQQCLLPDTEALSNESDARVEAYRELLRREPPSPPPPTPQPPKRSPPPQYHQYQPPPKLVNGRWWYPPPALRLVAQRPIPSKEATQKTSKKDSLWAKIPCECWHCMANPIQSQEGDEFQALFDWRKVYIGSMKDFSLPR